MITAGQQTQALGGFINQLGLGQNAPADRNHSIGSEDISALQFFVGTHEIKRDLGLRAREPIGTSARQFASLRRFIDIGRAQRVGLDAGLTDERDPARRARSEDELGTADHFCLRHACIERAVSPEKHGYLNR
jgi:hypothetical protein